MILAVTGATGLLGRLVIDELLKTESPPSIVAIVRDADKAASIADKGVQVRVASYSDPAALEHALEGVQKLLLVSGSEAGQRIAQHTSVIDAAKAVEVAHIIYTSAPHADTSSLILAPEHKATEEAIIQSAIPYTILRNNWYTENYVTAVEQARQSGEGVAATGSGRVASATRADFAAGAAAALTGEGHGAGSTS